METTVDLTPKELLSSFYENYNLQDDGGFADLKVKLEITKNFWFYIPNSDTRRKALLKHDIHHLITGYKSNFKGETEISSWEIASGCNRYWAAWILDSWGMIYGCWFNLRGVFKAFVRGRRSKNLYSDQISNEEALEIPVSELKEMLLIPPLEKNLYATSADYLLFGSTIVFGSVFSTATLILVPMAILYNLYLFLTGKF
jgi:hypothetical protein